MSHFNRNVKVGAALLLLTLFFILAALIARQPDDPFRGDAVVNPPFTSLTYGVHTALWWDKTWAQIHLDWVRLMVFSHVKQIFPWEVLEPKRGEWNFSRADELVGEVEQRGLKLVVRLTDAPEWSHPSMTGVKDTDYLDAPPDHLEDFGTYCGTLAARYPGRIAAYEVWNEPNLAREWGGRPPNAANYVDLLRVCSAAIRQADPQAIIISAGLAPTGTYTAEATPDDMYFQAMYDAGFQQYVDAVGLHAPGYAAPHIGPDEAQAKGSQRFFSFRRVEDMRKIMVANGDAAHQVAILEFGWTTDTAGYNPSYSWYAVDEATQARYVVEAYQYAAEHWRPWVGLMTVIYIDDPAWTPQDEEYWWGITTAEGIVRPAFIELANMAKYCGDRGIPARAPDSPEALGLVTVTPCS
ncbi:MAG: cellulase family glycosylhydrolase [Anaerolineae bacterium]|nr:cellulase family glycosylhydrolase [Anaerolineae bacterium]